VVAKPMSKSGDVNVRSIVGILTFLRSHHSEINVSAKPADVQALDESWYGL